ncbi:hypothetical protein EW146_g6251 [Bondarzewia mesenterica]|uniref:Uncharacterized protein n=1 Tax=Bondarzewia mesenterica TaxID=1095465 RepID=A0A4S4LR06_9AGAM|nr:hypothetical protein EW146_g6251 [Bondarzewia mesenterica]
MDENSPMLSWGFSYHDEHKWLRVLPFELTTLHQIHSRSPSTLKASSFGASSKASVFDHFDHAPQLDLELLALLSTKLTASTKTVLITGYADLPRLRVFATSRRVEAMQTLTAMGIETLSLDVTNVESIHAAQASVSELTGGKLDILVNNAGIAYASAAADITMNQVKALFDVNLFGAIAMVQIFLPLLMTSGDARILNVSSLAGLMPVPFNCAYNASKAALFSYGDTLRVELAPFNVKIAAGNVQSNIMKGAPTSLPPGSLYQPINAEFKELRIEKFQGACYSGAHRDGG